MRRPVSGVARAFAAAALRAFSILPGPVRAVLTWTFATVAWWLGIRRRVTLENLQHAFPEKTPEERRAIARETYRHQARAFVNAFRVVAMSPAELDQQIEYDGFEPLRKAAEAGTGAMVVSAHFGEWEVLAEVMARRGYKLSAVVRPLSGAVNAALMDARARSGLELIAQRGAVAPMIRALRAGRVVIQLIDQSLPAEHAVFVPFFGRPASTTPAPSVAAQRTGTPVFVVLGVRTARGLRMIVEGPLALPVATSRAEATRLHMAAMTAVVERHVRAHPEQWLWLHRRWKVQPPTSLHADAKADAG